MTKFVIGGVVHTQLSDHNVISALGTSLEQEKVVKGQALAKGACRFFLLANAGTLNYTDFAGNVHTDVAFPAGYHTIAVQSFQAGGTADGILACY